MAALVLAALTLVTVDSRSGGGGILHDMRAKVSDGFSPFQRATHAALRPIGNFLSGAVEYGSLRAENQRLRDQVASLQAQAQAAAAESSSAQAVLKESNLPFAEGIQKVVAEVIENGYSNFETAVVIDKGTSSGIARGEPVVSDGGLIGTVASAGSDTATIELLTDPSFAAGVKLSGGNTGTATGAGRDQPVRVAVDTTSDPTLPVIKVGQVLYTSGLDTEKFPPDIPVGKVVAVSQPAGPNEPEITLSPLVNLDHLDYLDVLLWSPQVSPDP